MDQYLGQAGASRAIRPGGSNASLDLASGCARGIRLLDALAARPGLRLGSGPSEPHPALKYWRETAEARQRWIADLEHAGHWHHQQADNGREEAAHQKHVADEIQTATAWLAQQKENWEKLAASHAAGIEELKAWNAQLQKDKRWQEDQSQNLQQELARRAEAIDELKRWNTEVLEGKAWLDGQVEPLGQAVTERDQQIQQLKHWTEQLESASMRSRRKSSAWNPKSRPGISKSMPESRFSTAVAEREARIRELESATQAKQDWIAQLEEAKAWLEEQTANWREPAERTEHANAELRAWIDQLQTGKDWLEGQRSRPPPQAEDRDRNVAALQEEGARLRESLEACRRMSLWQWLRWRRGGR